MKKIFAAAAVVVLVAFAAPAFAAVNPFIDVPINHWAYDAIGQLAARGVLSGYPDGTYKGKQPTTRYEMSSALARALALVDMTKASKQDVELLKKLVVEFKDELDALGVRVDGIDARLGVIESRLGGWQISGRLRVDVGFEGGEYGDDHNWTDSVKNGGLGVAQARVELDRFFGEDERYHLYVRLQEAEYLSSAKPDFSAYTNDPRDIKVKVKKANAVEFNKFYVEFPGWWDTKVTVGRFWQDFEGEYKWGTGGTFDESFSSFISDYTFDGLGIEKSFGLGKVSAHLAKTTPKVTPGQNASLGDVTAWEFALNANLQFTEQFGLDLGTQAWFGVDDYYSKSGTIPTTPRNEFTSLWTLYGGLRFNFNENIALKGIYFHQTQGWSALNGATAYDPDNGKAWKIVLDVKQDLLKFTSLWVEYGQVKDNFMFTKNGAKGQYLVDSGVWSPLLDGYALPSDAKIFRVGAKQHWNDKWDSWLFYSHITGDEFAVTWGGNSVNLSDWKTNQWGLGVQYTFNPNLTVALGYIGLNGDMSTKGTNTEWIHNNHLFRFRTQVTF